jgi:hypothetical protein
LILAWAARKKALQERLEKQAITGLKKCAQCREELPLEAFYGRSNARDGRADYCTPCIRKRKREQMYGITNETFEAMAEAQRGICAINTCKEPFDVVDHCHETNHVRGLLCERHNLLLHQSITPEELGAMAEYLNKSTSKKHITSEQ